VTKTVTGERFTYFMSYNNHSCAKVVIDAVTSTTTERKRPTWSSGLFLSESEKQRERFTGKCEFDAFRDH